jgi:hypothetical protein
MFQGLHLIVPQKGSGCLEGDIDRNFLTEWKSREAMK